MKPETEYTARQWHMHGKGGSTCAFMSDTGDDVPARMERFGNWTPAADDDGWFRLEISAPGDWARDEIDRDEPYRWVLWTEGSDSYYHHGRDLLASGDSLTEDDARADIEAAAALVLATRPPPKESA